MMAMSALSSGNVVCWNQGSQNEHRADERLSLVNGVRVLMSLAGNFGEEKRAKYIIHGKVE